MININKYNSQEAFAVDGNRPTDENCVSMVDNGVVCEGRNIIKTESQLGQKEVCLIVKDLVDGVIKYIPVDSFAPNTFDSSRYQLKDYLRYGECMGKQLKIHKANNGTHTWAVPNRYKLLCDTTANGGFHWAITINNSNKSGDVAWETGATLDSIAAQINAVQNMASVVAGDGFIRISVSSNNNSTLTLTDNTGATLVDLSLYVKIGNVAQAETHRTFTAQNVDTLFPDLGYQAACSANYGKNGLNMTIFCGVNLDRYKNSYRTNGAATWTAENAGRMNKATFNKCADGTIGGENGIALYKKYNGSWDAYMEAGMMNIEDTHVDGIEYQGYENGADQNAKLVSVTTMTFDGSYVPAYPAAAAASAAAFADDELGGVAHLPNPHEMALMFEAATYAAIRRGQSLLSGATLLSNFIEYWNVAEFSSYRAWFYYGHNGILDNYNKYLSYTVRPVLA